MIERIMLSLLFLLGFYGLVVKRNMIKKVYALAIMNMAVLLFFAVGGSQIGKSAPLVEPASDPASFVDPLPQALMLTAIVVGVCVSIVALAFIYRLYRLYKTLDCEKIRERVNDAGI